MTTPGPPPGSTAGAPRGGGAPIPADRDSGPAERPPEELDRLDSKAVALWRFEYALRGAVFVAAALLADLVFEIPLPPAALPIALAVISVMVVIFLPPARYRAWGFRLRPRDLYLRYGVLIRTTSIVPHARIQHVDTRHGPVDRALGLAEVVVFTAGTRGAIITIPALAAANAEELRDRLIALSGAGDAV